MTQHANPLEVAEKIARRANDVLDPLRIEMTIRKWPADFRAIMWQAVAATASQLQAEAEAEIER